MVVSPPAVAFDEFQLVVGDHINIASNMYLRIRLLRYLVLPLVGG